MTFSYNPTKKSGIACVFQRPEAYHSASDQHVLGRIVYKNGSAPPAIYDGAPQVGLHMVGAGIESFTEVWLTDRRVRSGSLGPLVYAEDGEYLFCSVRVDEQCVYRGSVRAAYKAAFELICRLGYPHIFRMWNFVGHITGNNAEGMETYQDFCIGRAGAFEEWSSQIRAMPAATGIGALGGGVDFYFLSCRSGNAQPLENPRQTPAYRYPEEYGPRSPSFARATYLRQLARQAESVLYVSGTASIIGNETVHLGDIEGQLDATITNIEELIGRNNLERHGIDDEYQLKDLDFIKVYVRDAEHLPLVRTKCNNTFPGHVNIVYLNVDICRRDLLVEIEGICRSHRQRT
jgi:chorismate lyase/3-hydroxybenzoate synthase